jgi:hypothetical protein
MIARLMGLDALPHGQAAVECWQHGGATSPAAHRHSVSKHIPRRLRHLLYRLLDLLECLGIKAMNGDAPGARPVVAAKEFD